MFIFALLIFALSATAQPRVLIVSPEQTGILQTGGLAHATTGLATALNQAGARTDVLMPHFTKMDGPSPELTPQKIHVLLDYREDGHAHKRSDFSVLRLDRPDNRTFFLRHDTIENQINYFQNENDKGYKTYGPDATIGESFGAFDKAAADFILTQHYDVVVLNDWTTGLIAVHLYEAVLRGEKVPKVIFAIHNIAYQGNFPPSLAGFLGLDWRHYTPEGYEFYGQINFMKAGMLFSDITYTVSRQYAKEIATPRYGASLDGVVRHLQKSNRIFGILNGITESIWDPARAMHGLKYTFNVNDLSGKAAGKAALQTEMNLPVTAAQPLFIMTSRLAEQKGYEYMIEAITQVVDEGSQWIVIGDGDPRYVEALHQLEQRFPNSVRYRPFSTELEHKLTRYADFAVNGAWFEPSGLNQFFAMKNGTIPVVSEVGGLVDSIKRDKTGFLFNIIPQRNVGGFHAYDIPETVESVVHEFRRAITVFRHDEKMNSMRRLAMSESHSWEARVREDFLPLFNDILAGPPVGCEPDLLP